MDFLLKGFFLGMGLIAAIGSQNAFVLRQSIKKQYPFLIALICTVCDVLLICIGSLGLGSLISLNTALLILFFFFGSLLLAYYAFIAARDVLSEQCLTPTIESKTVALKGLIFAAIGFSLLNPHAWLDTVVLIGTVSATFESEKKLFFTLGACLASFTWFFGLSLFGVFLSKYLQRSYIWKMINLVIFCILFYMSLQLFIQAVLRVMTL